MGPLTLILSVFNVIPAATVSAAPAGLGTYRVTTTSGLYVRSGAGTSYPIVSGISYGATFTVTQTNGSWGYAKEYGGWCSLDYAQLISSSNYVTPAPSNYTPRTTAPDTGNKYYKHTSYGGLNECILGSNQNSYKGSVIPNCVGYAWGRAYEISGKKPTLSKNNADTFWGRTSDGYARGQTAKLGAVVCWSGGSAGHVAVIESINGNTITISESSWGGTYFRTRTGTIQELTSWLGSSFRFQGYIYILN